MEVAIIGGGNFGTAIANIAASNGHATHLRMRDEGQVADCLAHRENRRYPPGHALAEKVLPTSDLREAVQRSTVTFMSVPSASFREVSGMVSRHTDPDDVVISATKGIERGRDGEGFLLMSQILTEVLPTRRIGVVSGPNLAEEIADGEYTGTVVASTCTSPLSRNYQLGHRLAHGLSLDQAVDDPGKLAEGVNTLSVVHERAAAAGVYMPQVDGLHRMMFEGADLGEVVAGLMTGGQAVDVTFARPAGPAAS